MDLATRQTFGKRGKVIHSQAREIIANVVAFMKREAECIQNRQELHIPITSYKQRAKAATGISEKMYKTILKECKAFNAEASTYLSTPREKRPKKKTYELVGKEKHVIRTLINEFPIKEKQTPSMKVIMKRMEDMGLNIGSESTMRNLIKDLGFRWQKTEDNNKILMESYDIRIKRIRYLKQLFIYREQGRPIFYTYGSYLHTSHLPNYSLIDNSAEGIKRSAKGRRLIMAHAGNENGFIENGLLLFPFGCKSGDYHNEMNWDNFEKWLKNQLLPNLPPHSVLVVHNASYHNTKTISEPTMATTKADMISWLVERNINHDPSATKPELYEIIKQYASKDGEYKLDSLLHEYGHSVLRLPPHHPELNPVENIWTQVKYRLAGHNVIGQSVNELMSLTTKAFDEVTIENWTAVCAQVHKLEQDYKNQEQVIDYSLDSLVFAVNTDSSDEDTIKSEPSDDDMDVGDFI